MKKIMTAALLLVLGAAQAMPIVPQRPSSQPANATVQRPGIAHGIADTDDDEAAPPVHIHHARATRKKPVVRKNASRRVPDPHAPVSAAPQQGLEPQLASPADASIAQFGIKK